MSQDGLVVLSLFDGMSCGQIALGRAGVKVGKYMTSEIDKFAQKVSSENFPENINLGDVKKINFTQLEKIDLLIGGSPCQGFSFSGKMLNFEDPRSVLFFEFARALKDASPKYFLLENVPMNQESQEVITNTLGVEPVIINSSLVSAQNRKRLYWTNIPFDGQPEDKGIFLKDILENDGDFTFMSKSTQERFERYGVKFVDEYTKKARCLTAGEYLKNGKQGNYVVQINPDKSAGGKQPHNQDRVYADNGKSPALTASFASRTNVGIIQRPRGFNKGGIFTEKSPTVTSHSWETNNHVIDSDFRIRKLTVLECKRLQTVPDNYKMDVSKSQAYKMLGNGWTVDVLAHIFKGLKK